MQNACWEFLKCFDEFKNIFDIAVIYFFLSNSLAWFFAFVKISGISLDNIALYENLLI